MPATSYSGLQPSRAIQPEQAFHGVTEVVEVRDGLERHFAGACRFPVTSVIAQVLRIQLARPAPADYNGSNFGSF